MKWWYAGLGLFLFVGCMVAIFSLYRASVDGVMKKVGLTGSDFSVSVIRDQLATIQPKVRKSIACGLTSRMRGTVTYLLSRDDQQGKLAFRIGHERIVCGASMLATGTVEEGTYEIVKGMNYLTQGYQFAQERVVIDSAVCKDLPSNETEGVVQQILSATRGKVFEIIWDEWGKVNRVREAVERVCIDRKG